MFFYSEQDIQNIILARNEWFEAQILSGSLSGLNATFGDQISFNQIGSRIIVGASRDKGQNNSSVSGLAYIFTSGTNGWIQESILSGSLATSSYDLFGYSVDINSVGDRVIIGAYGDEKADQASDLNRGLAYIFTSGTTGWIQESILSGSLAVDRNDYFGVFVKMNSSGNLVCISSTNDELSGTTDNGLVYIFASGTNGWTQQQILTGSLAVNTGDNFGNSIALNESANLICVGSSNDELSGTTNTGLVYIFASGTNGWTQQQILSGSFATDFNDGFGYSIALSENRKNIVIGALNDELSGTTGNGLVYIFASGTNGWAQQQILSGSRATGSFEWFGNSVAINSSSDYIIVGARQSETISGTLDTGLVYIFTSGTNGWTEKQILSGSLATSSYDYFGNKVIINSTGNKIAIAAFADEQANRPQNSGLVYIFDK